MITPDVHLDTTALLAAFARRDTDAVRRVFEAVDPALLALTLTQHLALAVRSPEMTIEEWVNLQVEVSEIVATGFGGDEVTQ